MGQKIFVTAQFLFKYWYLHGLSVGGSVTTPTVYWYCNEPVLMECVCIVIYQFCFCLAGVASDSVHQQETRLLSEPRIQAYMFRIKWKIHEQ
jgi:hypothetical protein